MNMFTNYEYIPDGYIPNNMHIQCDKPQSYTKLQPMDTAKPYELYSAKGELEGYFWHYGDCINLQFSIVGEITLDDGTDTGSYINAADFLKDKTITIQLYNFRLEPIHSITLSGANLISDNAGDPVATLSIDAELSKELVKGIYYCSMTVSGNAYNETIFNPEDCKLLVK